MKRAREEENSRPLHLRVQGVPLVLRSEYAAAAAAQGVSLRAVDHMYLDAQHPDRYYMPASTLQARFFPVFDEQHWAERVAGTRARGGRYRELSADQVRALWARERDEAARLGTLMHAQFERYYNGELLDASMRAETEHFYAFQRDHPYLLPVAVERVFVDRELQLAGTADAIFRDLRDPDPRAVVIVDWKRSRELRTTAYNDQHGCLTATRDLPDCNYQKFRINMGLYKYMAEKHTGVRVTSMLLVGCHPDHEQYECLNVEWSRDHMNEIIAERLRDKLCRPGGLTHLLQF